MMFTTAFGRAMQEGISQAVPHGRAALTTAIFMSILTIPLACKKTAAILRDEKPNEVFPYLNRIEKTLRDQGFSVKRTEKEDIKRILAVYFEQNVTTEKFEDFDGERWVIFGD